MYWERPEAMEYDRPAFLVSEEKPGSDVAAEMAAAMAVSYKVFEGKQEIVFFCFFFLLLLLLLFFIYLFYYFCV